MAILRWHEALNMNTILGIANLLRVVHSATISALVLVLFNVYQNIIWETEMNESVETTTVGLQLFGLANVVREICQDKAILSLSSQTKKLQMHSFFDKTFLVFSIYHVTDA